MDEYIAMTIGRGKKMNKEDRHQECKEIIERFQQKPKPKEESSLTKIFKETADEITKCHRIFKGETAREIRLRDEIKKIKNENQELKKYVEEISKLK